jgi:hypothetical protein
LQCSGCPQREGGDGRLGWGSVGGVFLLLGAGAGGAAILAGLQLGRRPPDHQAINPPELSSLSH